MSSQLLAKKVLARHLSQTVKIACTQCSREEELPASIDGKPTPPWRTVAENVNLCSDLCERRYRAS